MMAFLVFFQTFGQSQTCECSEGGIITIGDNVKSVNYLSQILAEPNPKLPPGGLDGCRRIHGKLIIDTGLSYSFLPGASLIMEAGSSIEILLFRKLIVDDATFKGCAKLWAGIQVQKGGSIDIRNSRLSDALNGINVRLPAVAIVMDNEFDANYKGIVFQGSSSAPVIGTNSFVGSFAGNHFKCTYDLKPGWTTAQVQSIIDKQSYAAIIAQNLNDFKVIGTSANKVTIDKHRHGIKASFCKNVEIRNAGFSNILKPGSNISVEPSVGVRVVNCPIATIANNLFTDTDYGIVPINSGGTITGNEFIPENQSVTNTRIGIYSAYSSLVPAILDDNLFFLGENSAAIWITDVFNPSPADPLSTVSTVRIERCTINVADNKPFGAIGIRLDRINAPIRILGNELRGKFSPLTMTDCDAHLLAEDDGLIADNLFVHNKQSKHRGIRLLNCTGLQVVNNSIEGSETYLEFGYGEGMDISNSPDNLYCCNSITGTYKGMYFSNPCLDTRLRNTAFGKHLSGLWLDYSTILSPQLNHGNIWSPLNDANEDAVYFANLQDLADNKFRTETALFPVNPIDGPQDWFTDFGEDASCSLTGESSCGETPINPATGEGGEDGASTGDTDFHIAEMATSSDPVQAGKRWMAQCQLFEKLSRHPYLIDQDLTVQSFYQAASIGNIGRFYAVKQGLSEIFNPSASLAIAYQQAIESMHDLAIELEPLWQVVMNLTSTNTQIQEAEAEIAQLELQENALAATMENIDSQLDSLRTVQINALIQLNNGVPASAIFETNQKQVNAVFLETVGLAEPSATAAQLLLIENIANQCPATGGGAVYTARSMRAGFIQNPGLEYNDYSICGFSEERTKKSANLSTPIGQLIPNPATETVELKFESALKMGAEVSVTDLTGKTWLQMRANEAQQSIRINVASLSPGIYFVWFNANGQHASVHKLVIQNP